MYEVVRAVKFNGEYFENGDIVDVTLNNGKIITGSIMIANDDVSPTNNNSLALDTSDKYHSKIKYIYNSNIKNIQKTEV